MHLKGKNFLRGILLAGILATVFTTKAAEPLSVASPNGTVRVSVLLLENGGLGYEVTFRENPVIESSPLGITIDGTDLGNGVEIKDSESYSINETYPWRGAHALAINHCNGLKVNVFHSQSQTRYLVDVRAYNDGIALRYTIPGKGSRVVSGESTAFRIPEGSTLWYHDFYMHYEGRHEKKDIADVGEGEWAAPPLTIRLPNELGYAAITESAIINYSGMGLRATGDRGFQVTLGHETQVSHPYELRYEKEDIERLAKPAAIEGTIHTPWRVVMIGADLNALFNCDIVHNLAPAPDPKLFPKGFEESWLKPGRAVWDYLTDEPRTLDGMKNLARLAGELGFEYQVVEGQWRRWTDEEQKEFTSYAGEQNVRALFWMHSRDLQDRDALKAFFKHLDEVGAAGAKIDFFDHEAKETMDLYRACLEEAAKYRLILDFHGANKPAGESRTWPNEMTREAIRGYEMRGPWAKHNTTLPFTRMLAGHADYTPLYFGDRRCETSETHQIASAMILQAPLLVYAEHPANILKHDALEVIKQIPSVWDETIVLPGSEIGELSAFARRKGDKWFISVMNGEEGRFLTIDLSFLEDGDRKATFVRDNKPESAMVSLVRERLSFGTGQGVAIDKTIVRNHESLMVELIPGGGFVAVIE